MSKLNHSGTKWEPKTSNQSIVDNVTTNKDSRKKKLSKKDHHADTRHVQHTDHVYTPTIQLNYAPVS